MKLPHATNNHQESGNCRKGFQGQQLKVKVIQGQMQFSSWRIDLAIKLRLAVCCPSVSTCYTWHDVFIPGGGISMKRGRNICHVRGDAEKVFKVMRSEVKVIKTFAAGGIQIDGPPSKPLFWCICSDCFNQHGPYYKQLKTTAIFRQDNNNRHSNDW